MVSVRFSQRERGVRPAGWAPAPQTQLAEELIALGVDDLAKYRLAELFSTSPGIVRDATTCAEGLGLHSVELTDALLEQMAASGILVSPLGVQRFGRLYLWAANTERCRRLHWLLGLSRLPAYRPLVLRTLAARSFRRAEERGRSAAARREDEVAGAVERVCCRA